MNDCPDIVFLAFAMVVAIFARKETPVFERALQEQEQDVLDKPLLKITHRDSSLDAYQSGIVVPTSRVTVRNLSGHEDPANGRTVVMAILSNAGIFLLKRAAHEKGHEDSLVPRPPPTSLGCVPDSPCFDHAWRKRRDGCEATHGWA